MNENSFIRPLAVAAVSVSLACGLVACQGVFNVDFDKAHVDGGASSSGSIPTSSGAAGGTNGTTTGTTDIPNPGTVGTLAGKWEINGALPGQSSDFGTVDISANAFRIAIGYVVFDFSAATDHTTLSYTRYGDTHPVEVDHRGAAVNWGLIPFSRGGSLTFKDPVGHSGPCNLNLGAPSSSFACTDRVDKWPNVLPQPLEGARYEMTRINQQASSFGDLGGQWQAKEATRPDTCTLTFAGDRIYGYCPPQVKRMGGKFDATFRGDVVSGHLSGGVEFAGNKQ